MKFQLKYVTFLIKDTLIREGDVEIYLINNYRYYLLHLQYDKHLKKCNEKYLFTVRLY
jgi:hypothetical protein